MVPQAAARFSPPLRESAGPVSMRSQPALNLTAVTGGLIAANLVVHLVRLAMAPELDRTVLLRFGFAPSLFLTPTGALSLPPDPAHWLSPLTYSFLHGDFLHLLVNTGFLLAFGTLVERRLGSRRFLVFYLVMAVLSVGGTVTLYAITQVPVLVIGASGAVAGLFGAAARFAFTRRRLVPTAELPGPRRWPRGLLLAVLFIGINLVFGLIGLADFGGIRAIAWEAHITGFLAGVVLFPLFDRQRPAPFS